MEFVGNLFVYRAGEDADYSAFASEKEIEDFAFHFRMETADYGNIFAGGHFCGPVERREYRQCGYFARSKITNLLAVK